MSLISKEYSLQKKIVLSSFLSMSLLGASSLAAAENTGGEAPNNGVTEVSTNTSSKHVHAKKEHKSEISALKDQITALMKKVEALEAAQKVSDVKHEEKHAEIEKIKAAVVEPTDPKKTETTPEKKVVSEFEKVKVTLSGQVNRLAGNFGNGAQTRFTSADNDISGSRFRVLGAAKINDEFSAGTRIEVAVRSNSTADTEVNTKEQSSSALSIRWIDFSLKSNTVGTLFMGKGSMFSDESSERDLSGTYVATGASGPEQLATGMKFVNNTTGLNTGPQIGDVYSGMPGLRRLDRVRYDTPSFYGFTLGSSFATGGGWDAGLNYAGDIEGTKIQGSLAYARRNGPAAITSGAFNGGTNFDNAYKQVDGSLSVRIPLGLSLTGGFGDRKVQQTGRKRAKMWYGKLGYDHKFFDIGTSAFSIDYGQTKDLANNTSNVTTSGLYGRAKTYSFAFVQQLDGYGVELYATVRRFKFDSSNGTNFRPITMYLAGGRLKF